ncbi:MAG: hypothetical protein JRI68_09510 [Deltaproteobacteria bacterium]|nr:hypothetical protein [Deltaproteobacteria bacterium]
MNPPPDAYEERLLDVTERVGKSYGFDNVHDPRRPVEFFFQESEEGVVLFLVFYTRACRWSLCTGCTLPSTGSQHPVGYRDIMAQIDCIFAEPEVGERAAEIRKVIVSNQGSVLDEDTFSSTALMYLIAKINLHLPLVSVVSLETRPEYVDDPELEFVARAIAESEGHTVLELAVGFEAFDDTIRNDHFRKGLSLNVFEELVDRIAAHGFHLKCYFMQKPVVGMTDEEAVTDIHAAIDYLARLAEERNVHIGMHLNPTYAARGTPLAEAYEAGTYQPPLLVDVARAARHGRGKDLHLFLGLNDEGLAVEGGTFIRPGDEPVVEQLERFNRTQDYDLLDAVAAG